MQKLKIKLHSFLRQSEKWTKTDMVYLSHGGFWLGFSKMVSLISSFFSSVAFANLLSPTTYGIYRFFLSTVSLLTVSNIRGINTALTRSVARGYDGSFVPAIKTKMKWGLLGGITGIGISIYYYLQGNNTLSVVFLISSVFIPLMDPIHLYIALLNGKKLFYLSAKYTVIIRIISTIILIATVFILPNLFLLVFVYFISNTLLRLFFLHITLKKVKLNSKQDRSTISFGKHLTLMSVLGQFSVYLDKVLVFHYIGAPALAGYFLAFIPFKQIQNLFSSLNMLALPKFSSTSIQELKKSLPKKVIKFYLIILPTILLYFITASWFFEVFYPKYPDAAFISKLLMLQLLFYPITMMGTAITAQAQKKKLYISSVSYSIIRIILLLILVPIFKVYGAVAAIVLTGLISCMLTVFLFFRMKPEKNSNFSGPF